MARSRALSLTSRRERPQRNATGTSRRAVEGRRRRLGRFIHGDIRSRTRPCPPSGRDGRGCACARGRITTARRGAVAGKSRHGAAAKYATDGLTTEVRHGGRRRRRVSAAAAEAAAFVAAAAAAFTAAVSEAAVPRSMAAGLEAAASHPSRRLSRRAVFRGGGMRYGYRHAYHRPHFRHRHHFHRRIYAPSLLRYPVLLWLPAPLLPGRLDLFGPRKICRYRPWTSPLCVSLLWIPDRYW